MSTIERDGIVERVRDARVDVVHLHFMDILGTIKGVIIPVARLEASLDRGTWFDGSAVYGAARVAEGDLYLHPDPTTFVVVPWETEPTARLICSLRGPDGDAFTADPRQALARVLQEALELGYEYRVAAEVEFFIFEDQSESSTPTYPPTPIDGSGYFELSSSRATTLCRTAAKMLETLGYDVQASHHEVAPSQYEIDFGEMGAMQLADAIATFKWMLRDLARQEGVVASFMPRPFADSPGSGLHFHQVLASAFSGENAFFDADAAYDLSPVARAFVAGQLAHARGMCAVLAPLVNSYKRLMSGDEAPAQVTWARNNRGALIRVPEATLRSATRVELRAADPSCNPYLALAVGLKAGLDGIAGQLTLPEPLEQSELAEDRLTSEMADPLPKELGEALEELEWDPVARDALGQHIFEQFLAAKELEWGEFRRHVSAWELDHYLHNA